MRLRRHFDMEESHGIDLAPMLDFVMNLLIFFIITAVFAKEIALLVNRPQGDLDQQVKSQESGSGSIPIQILANGEIWMDGRVVDVRAVRANVERLHAVNPKYGVLIIAEKEAETGVMVQVVDQVKLGGIDNITFSTT
jgi:biopolymer transport protein ExbD